MDNLTHSLLGAALAKTGLGRLHPRSGALLVLGANLPDLDVATWFIGREAYLVHHRGVTHGLAGACAQALLLAGAVRVWEHWRRAPATSFRALLALSVAGVLSHPLLDLLNNYGLRPWLPFDATWYYGDLVFIVDPWLWLIFGGAAALAGGRSRGGDFGLALSAGLGSLAVFGSGHAPTWFQILWAFAVSAIALARRAELGRRRARGVLAAASVAALGYLGVLAAFRARAEDVLRQHAERSGAPIETDAELVRTPAPIDPRVWTFLVPTERAYVLHTVESDGSVGAGYSFPRLADNPRVAAALANPCTAWWRSFARAGFARVTESAAGTQVQLGDARYDAPWCQVDVLVRPDGSVEPLAPSGAGPRMPLRSPR